MGKNVFQVVGKAFAGELQIGFFFCPEFCKRGARIFRFIHGFVFFLAQSEAEKLVVRFSGNFFNICAAPKIRKNPARAEKTVFAEQINPGNIIEENFVCSEKHRAFFKEQIGKSFSFNVAFQKWLKSNSGKTYADAIAAYHQIQQEKKNTKTEIGSQFEYNTYIRDFFAANKDKSLEQAIKCWKFKKSQKGSHKYEKSDLAAIQKPEK